MGKRDVMTPKKHGPIHRWEARASWGKRDQPEEGPVAPRLIPTSAQHARTGGSKDWMGGRRSGEERRPTTPTAILPNIVRLLLARCGRALELRRGFVGEDIDWFNGSRG